MADIMNNFTTNCLEVIFGIFIVCTIANMVLGIDIFDGLRKLWEKITGRSSRED